MIYFIIVGLLIYLSYRYDYCNAVKGRNVWIIILLITFICLSGFRYRIGEDTVNYLRYYENLRPIENFNLQSLSKDRYAPGFVIILSIFKSFTSDFTYFQIFHSIIVNSVVFYFLRNNSRHLFFSLLVFFIFLYALLLFQQIRESLAVSIFLLAWPSFRDGKWLKWYIFSFLALMFHLSSSVMLLLPLLCLPGVRELFVFGTRTWFIGLAVLLLGFAVQFAFFKYIQMLAIAESVTERAEAYSKSELSGSSLNIVGVIGFFFRYILYVVVSLYFIHKNRRLSNEESKMGFNKMESMALISVFVSLISISVSILTRFNNYFFIFAILFISDFAYSVIPIMGRRIRLKFIYWMIIFLPMFGFEFSGSYLGNINKSGTLKQYMVYYPYSSCFDQTIDAKREAAIRYRRSH